MFEKLFKNTVKVFYVPRRHDNSASVTTKNLTPATTVDDNSAAVVTEAPLSAIEVKTIEDQSIENGEPKSTVGEVKAVEAFEAVDEVLDIGKKEVAKNVIEEPIEIESIKKVSDYPTILDMVEHMPKQLEAHEPYIIVSFKEVTKKFGQKVAIQDVSFDIIDLPNQGELISIVGPSGCGKSTILRIIAGLKPQFPPTSGAVLVNGKIIEGPSVIRGVVDQKYSLLPHLTVVDNIAFGLMLQGMKKKERREKAMEWVKKVDLLGAENKYPKQLSGGMQQRVSLASTLILEPRILLMDEPFGALDPKTRLKMQELLVQLWKEIEATIFIVTHSMEEAVYLGDRIFRMESDPGRLVEVLEAPRPDVSPEEMRKEVWFSEMVQELLQRVEQSSGVQGELKALQKMKDSSPKKEYENVV